MFLIIVPQIFQLEHWNSDLGKVMTYNNAIKYKIYVLDIINADFVLCHQLLKVRWASIMLLLQYFNKYLILFCFVNTADAVRKKGMRSFYGAFKLCSIFHNGQDVFHLPHRYPVS